MPGAWISAGSGTDFPRGWRDEIVVHAFRKNKDHSVSVEATVNIYSPDGTVYGRNDVKIRLPQTSTKKKALKLHTPETSPKNP